MLSAKNTISDGGCGQVFCFSVGTTGVSLVRFFLLREACSGGSVPLPSFDSSLLLEAGVAEKWD
jgi:hypothetical protein